METNPSPAKKASLWTKDFIQVGSTNLLNGICMQILITVLPLFLDSKGFSASMIGTVATLYTIGAMTMRFVAGNLIDRMGRRKIGMTGMVVVIISYIGYLLSILFENGLSTQITLPNGTLLTLAMLIIILCRVLQGFGYSTTNISTSTMVADILPRERFAEGIGYFGLFNSLSTAFGPALGLVLLGVSNELTFSFLLIVALLAALMMNSLKYETNPEYVAATKKAEAEEGDKFASDTRGLWRFFEKRALPASAITFILGICVAATSNFLALYAKSIGLSGIGFYFTVQAGAMIISRLSSGKLSSKIGVYRTIIIGLSIMALSFLGLSIVKNMWMLYACAAIFGFGAGMTYPTLQVLAVSGVARNRRGTANSTYQAFWDIGSGVGASVWGYTIDFIGSYSIIFAIAGIIVIADFALAIILSKKVPSAL